MKRKTFNFVVNAFLIAVLPLIITYEIGRRFGEFLSVCLFETHMAVRELGRLLGQDHWLTKEEKKRSAK